MDTCGLNVTYPMGSHLNTWSSDGCTPWGGSFAEESVLLGVGFNALYPVPPPVYPVLPEFDYNVTSQPPATTPSLAAIFLPNHDGLYPTRTISQNKPIFPSFAVTKVVITAMEKQLRQCPYSVLKAVERESYLSCIKNSWQLALTPGPGDVPQATAKWADWDLQLWGENKELPLRWSWTMEEAFTWLSTSSPLGPSSLSHTLGGCLGNCLLSIWTSSGVSPAHGAGHQHTEPFAYSTY